MDAPMPMVMPMVVLLRGINVGGANRISMAELRAIADGCGFTDVRSYIQSGNLVVHAGTPDTGLVADQLRAAIAHRTSIAPDVIVRSGDELAAVAAANPFAGRADPAHLHVVFMPGDTPATTGDVDLDAFAPETAVAIGRELHLHLPSGMGRSRLAAALDRATGSVGTTRNWRTVTTLLQMTGPDR